MSVESSGGSSSASTHVAPSNSSTGAAARSSGNTLARAKRGAQVLKSEVTYPVDVSVKSLLEAGAHFGHQTQKWNPKMLPNIYTAKNGIHIINLDVTMSQWKNARKYIVDTVGRGGTILFVGTKIQAREIIEQEAERCGAFYVTTRWLGGTLSNFQTIKNSIDRMRKLEELLEQAEVVGTKVRLTKKEKLEISREVIKLEESLGGIRNMKRPPNVIFVVDVIKETITVQEARRLRIPVVAMVDTNADPERIEFPVASNDDAARAIRLFTAAAADAVIEGKAVFSARSPRERAELSNAIEGREGPPRSEHHSSGGSSGGPRENVTPAASPAASTEQPSAQ